jgi:hypothetical protein
MDKARIGLQLLQAQGRLHRFGSYCSGWMLRANSAVMNRTAGKTKSSSKAAMERRIVFIDSLCIAKLITEQARNLALFTDRSACDYCPIWTGGRSEMTCLDSNRYTAFRADREMKPRLVMQQPDIRGHSVIVASTCCTLQGAQG